MVKRQLRKNTGVLVEYSSIVNAVRKLLNEAAASALDEVRLRVPQRKPRTRQAKNDAEAAAGEVGTEDGNDSGVSGGTDGGEGPSPEDVSD